MPPSANPGEPKEAPKPQPIGNIPFVILFTICTLCCIFILWRRASVLRAVVGYQLKTWTRQEGGIRLSMDDAPAAREFLDDDYDEDNPDLADDEPLAFRAQELRPQPTLDRCSQQPSAEANDEDEPPPPPPKI